MRYRILIVLATIIWGSSFVIVKDVTTMLSPAWILVIRFAAAALIMAVALLKYRGLYFERSHVGYGLLFGVAMFLAYYTQTIGITDTTPGKNAFLTGTYCVIVPFLAWLLLRRRPNRYNIVAAVLCIAGIGFISLDDSLTMRFGDIMTLVCAFFYARRACVRAHPRLDRASRRLLALPGLPCRGVHDGGAAVPEHRAGAPAARKRFPAAVARGRVRRGLQRGARRGDADVAHRSGLRVGVRRHRRVRSASRPPRITHGLRKGECSAIGNGNAGERTPYSRASDQPGKKNADEFGRGQWDRQLKRGLSFDCANPSPAHSPAFPGTVLFDKDEKAKSPASSFRDTIYMVYRIGR